MFSFSPMAHQSIDQGNDAQEQALALGPVPTDEGRAAREGGVPSSHNHTSMGGNDRNQAEA